MLAAVMFAPPLTLGFTATRSNLSPAILVAAAYLPWRLLHLRGRIPSGRTPFGVVTIAAAAYVALHSVYYLVAERNLVVFLMEAQWATYFAAFASVLFDVQGLPEARARVVRSLLVVILVEAGLGMVSAFTGPIFDIGAWHEDRFGIGVYRATGTLGSPNGFAGVMAVGALLAAFERRSALPLPRVVTLPPLLLALFWSQSKSGWLAFLAAATLVLLVRFVGTASARDSLLALALGTFLVIGVRNPEVWGELERDYSARSTFGEETLERYARADPLRELFGVGFRQTARIDHETRAWLTAHNSYLSLLAEIGALGLLLLGAVWAATLREIARARDWAMLGVLACILLHVYSEAFLYGNVYILLMLAVLSFASMARAEIRRARSPLAIEGQR
jgi:hypothetical protein